MPRRRKQLSRAVWRASHSMWPSAAEALRGMAGRAMSTIRPERDPSRRTVERVVFACMHNAGRSQMAAAFFNQLADTLETRAKVLEGSRAKALPLLCRNGGKHRVSAEGSQDGCHEDVHAVNDREAHAAPRRLVRSGGHRGERRVREVGGGEHGPFGRGSRDEHRAAHRPHHPLGRAASAYDGDPGGDGLGLAVDARMRRAGVHDHATLLGPAAREFLHPVTHGPGGVEFELGGPGLVPLPKLREEHAHLQDLGQDVAGHERHVQGTGQLVGLPYRLVAGCAEPGGHEHRPLRERRRERFTTSVGDHDQPPFRSQGPD